MDQEVQENTNEEYSIVVVSNDNLSQKIQINKTTNFENFCQDIINQFPENNIFNRKLFYYEAYSHDIIIISNEEEYVTANKKGIEYFYLCDNECDYTQKDDNIKYYNYLKYYSVIIFSPIRILNTEFQNNQRKKMKMRLSQNSNKETNNNNLENMKLNESNKKIINNNKINYSMNNYMYNPMLLNNSMNPMINPMMNSMMNNNMMNPMMNTNVMNTMMNTNVMNPMMNPMMKPMMNNNMMNPMMNNNMMNPMMNNNIMYNNYMNNNVMKNILNTIYLYPFSNKYLL